MASNSELFISRIFRQGVCVGGVTEFQPRPELSCGRNSWEPLTCACFTMWEGTANVLSWVSQWLFCRCCSKVLRVLNVSSGKTEQDLICDALDIVSGDRCYAFSKLTFISSDIWPSTQHILIQQFWQHYQGFSEALRGWGCRDQGRMCEAVSGWYRHPTHYVYFSWHVWIDWWHRNCLRRSLGKVLLLKSVWKSPSQCAGRHSWSHTTLKYDIWLTRGLWLRT